MGLVRKGKTGLAGRALQDCWRAQQQRHDGLPSKDGNALSAGELASLDCAPVI